MHFFKKSRARERQSFKKAGAKSPMTYYRSGTSAKKEELTQKKIPKNGKMVNFIAFARHFAVIILLLSLGAYSLILKSVPEISINSKSYRSVGEYQEAATESLRGLANRNKITVDQNAVIDYLALKFPEIKSARLQMPLFGQTPQLEIAVAPPSLFVQSKRVLYVVDSQGRIIGQAMAFKSIKQLTQVNDESEFEAKAGSQFLSSQAVAFISILSRQLESANVEIESITLPALPNELHLRPTSSSFYVKFNLAGDPNIQAGQYLAAKTYFLSKGQLPSEYIDARITGKIFYK